MNTQLHPLYAHLPTYTPSISLLLSTFPLSFFLQLVVSLPSHLISFSASCSLMMWSVCRHYHLLLARSTSLPPARPPRSANAHCLSTWTKLEDDQTSGASVMWPRYTPDVRVFSYAERRRRKLRTSPGDGELPLLFPLLKLSALTIYAFMKLGNDPSQPDKKKKQHRETQEITVAANNVTAAPIQRTLFSF